MKTRVIGLAALLVLGTSAIASAQTMSYAEAGARIAGSCGASIERFCAKDNIGTGRVLGCLRQHEADVPAQCFADFQAVSESIDKRVAAQARAFQVCEANIREYCPGVKPGDARVLDCLDMAKKVVGGACKQVLLDAGWQ
ncbi:hypothetical protein [Ancylobacter sp. G4_0304]|uniref:hypothetical protein n=1 Tax=Ancylobacter sp. G4_0304 TaxID=3114289 RepID=UPI0039C5BCBD